MNSNSDIDEILFDDDLLLAPSLLGIKANKINITNFLNTYEEFYQNKIFDTDIMSSEFLNINGSSEIIFEGNNPTLSIINGDENLAHVNEGSHSIVHGEGSLKINQNGGNLEILHEMDINSSLDLHVIEGSLKIILDIDGSDRELRLVDNQLFLGDHSTNININFHNDGNNQISIYNLRDNSHLNISEYSAPDFNNQADFIDKSIENISAAPTHDINSNNLTDDVIIFNDKIQNSPTSENNIEYFSNDFYENGALSASDLYNFSDYFIDEILNFENEISNSDSLSEDLPSVIESSEQNLVTTEKIIEISDLSEISWESAFQIIEEL